MTKRPCSPGNLAAVQRRSFAANQNSNNIVPFKIDPNTGQLSPIQHVLDITAPVCVVFVPAALTQNHVR